MSYFIAYIQYAKYANTYNVYMQYKNQKTLLLAKTIGSVIKDLRCEKNYSINKFANEYGLDIGNTSRIEKGSIDVKMVTLWICVRTVILNCQNLCWQET